MNEYRPRITENGSFSSPLPVPNAVQLEIFLITEKMLNSGNETGLSWKAIKLMEFFCRTVEVVCPMSWHNLLWGREVEWKLLGRSLAHQWAKHGLTMALSYLLHLSIVFTVNKAAILLRIRNYSYWGAGWNMIGDKIIWLSDYLIRGDTIIFT